MTETAHADTPGRHGVDRVFFSITYGMPGVSVRWFLDNETTIVLPPGQPLDLRLSCQTFKEMMAQHLILQKAVSADVRHYLQDLGRGLVKFGAPLAILAVVLANSYYIVHHHRMEFHRAKSQLALHDSIKPGCIGPTEPPPSEHAGLPFP